MEAADFKKKYYACWYLVVYAARLPEQPYQPVVSTPGADTTHPHGFDTEMLQAMPALWYCNHLPRYLGELSPASTFYYKQARDFDVPSHILVMPQYMCQEFTLEKFSPVLILADDRLRELAQALDEQLTPPLGVTLFSQLSERTLQEHWRQLATLSGSSTEGVTCPPLAENVLNEPHRLIFTMLERRLGGADDVEREFLNAENDRRYEMLFEAHAAVDALGELADVATEQMTAERAAQTFEDAQRTVQFPVAVAVPGLPKRYVREWLQIKRWRGFPEYDARDMALSWNEIQRLSDDPELAEESILRLLLTHRGRARNGLAFRARSATSADFSQVADLEKAATAKTESPRKMWKMLRAFSARGAELMGADVMLALRRASHLCLFTNIPIGLMIPPGQSDPLAISVPLSYRPLVPLTRCLQFELAPAYNYYPARRCRALVVECLKPTDRIYKLSRLAWNIVEDYAPHGGVSVRRVNVSSVRELCAEIERDVYDVLVISAHGFYDGNRAGLWVHDELCLDIPVSRIPPVVILSACHTAPRGQVNVSITDLLLRRGAKAILATLIPVDVIRNAHLMRRLFIYWADAVNNVRPMRDLAHLWRYVVASNAVLDVAEISPQIRQWFYESGAQLEFMLRESAGKLRFGHTHSITTSILLDMARRDNPKIGSLLERLLRERSYYPETFFYYWIGWPEHVIFQSRMGFEDDLMKPETGEEP